MRAADQKKGKAYYDESGVERVARWQDDNDESDVGRGEKWLRY